MTSTKFLDFFEPLPPCPHLDLIYNIKFLQPHLLRPQVTPLPLRCGLHIWTLRHTAALLHHLPLLPGVGRDLRSAPRRAHNEHARQRYATPLQRARHAHLNNTADSYVGVARRRRSVMSIIVAFGHVCQNKAKGLSLSLSLARSIIVTLKRIAVCDRRSRGPRVVCASPVRKAIQDEPSSAVVMDVS